MVLHIIRADILLIARICLRNSQNICAYYMQNHQIRYMYQLIAIYLKNFSYDVATTAGTCHAKFSLVIFLTVWFSIPKTKTSIFLATL